MVDYLDLMHTHLQGETDFNKKIMRMLDDETITRTSTSNTIKIRQMKCVTILEALSRTKEENKQQNIQRLFKNIGERYTMKEEIDDELSKVEMYNKIYSEKGFNGIIQTLEDKLHLGRITWKPNGIVCITTGGWSDDEEIIHNLLHIVSQFGHNHYLGYVVGGVYYFSKERDCGYVAIQKELSDDETSNPAICQWCMYSCDGKRDAARSITMCDGCRYNQEFRMKGELKQNDL